MFVHTRRMLLLAVTLGALSLTVCHTKQAPHHELHIAMHGVVSTPDPYAENSIVAFSIYSNIYEPLVAHDQNLKVTPVLATEWRNPDDLNWILSLRSDVRFQDGSPLTAEDVKASLDRAAGASSDMAFALWMIDHVTVIGVHEVKITTKFRYASLLSNLTEVLILPAKYVSDGRSHSNFAPGTGSYRVRSWTPGSNVVLEKNASYWGGAPDFDRVTFETVTSLDQRIAGLESGEFDILPQLEPNAARNPSVIKDKKISVTNQQGVGVIYLGMDLSHEKSPYVQAENNPFMDIRVRKAVMCAINTRHIVHDILDDFADEADELVAPTMFGFNPQITRPKYDPELAKALLAEAGYPNGFRVRFDFTKDRYRNDAEIGKAIAADLQKIGIDAQPNPLPRQELFAIQKAQDSSFYMVGWFLTNGDASNLFESLIHTRDQAHHYGSENAGGYSNPLIDRAIEANPLITEPPNRADELKRIMKMTMDDLPYIPLYIEHNVCAYSSALQWQPRPDEYIFLKDIHLK